MAPIYAFKSPPIYEANRGCCIWSPRIQERGKGRVEAAWMEGQQSVRSQAQEEVEG